ncbi:MAG TPA: glucose 1-dehydrogenase [Candidatus Methylomirabilis sp.]|nr:glucose 1-dehydrogenase [Candidatus Methylomirabilis sp.]
MGDLFGLAGQRALITGASSGLGRHFALTLARAGAAVALAARSADKLADAAAEIRGLGGKAVAVTLDVTDAASIREGVARTEAELGPITILVNNAGVVVGKPLFEHDENDWDRVMDTNLKGAWLVAHEVARRMVAQAQGGAIINIASILGLRVVGGVPVYSASKAGLIHLTKVLALELARHKIRVNAIAPGYITTDLNRDFLQSQAGQAIIRRIPQRRAGEPDDLDGALLLLASDASRYMTGVVIPVDGGHLTSTL